MKLTEIGKGREFSFTSEIFDRRTNPSYTCHSDLIENLDLRSVELRKSEAFK